MTAAYLVANPPRRSQFRRPRRATPTGSVVMHTAEIAPDLAGEDLGAERIARFISTRTDAPGSYHLIGDRDSQILLVPFEWEAFGDGTGSNPWAIHISLAVTAAWFRAAPNDQKLWYMARLATMARTASDWLEQNHGITVPARRLTPASSNQAGFCTHMDRENWRGTPGRRGDPWGVSDSMWHLFLTLYEDTRRTPTPQEDDTMHGTEVIAAYGEAGYLNATLHPDKLAQHWRDIRTWTHAVYAKPVSERDGAVAYIRALLGLK